MGTTLFNISGELTPDEWDGNLAELWDKGSAHGLAQGDHVKLTATDWEKGQADALANESSGIVLFVPSANTAWIATIHGLPISWASHGQGTQGQYLWADPSIAGAYTTTMPAGGPVRQRLALVRNLNEIIWLGEPGVAV